jgi:phosphoribosylformylglycinamidine cyclo-ligase
LFKWLAGIGGIDALELARTFNCGIGMVVVVGAGDVAAATARLEAMGETVWTIGAIEAASGPARVKLTGLQA